MFGAIHTLIKLITFVLMHFQSLRMSSIDKKNQMNEHLIAKDLLFFPIQFNWQMLSAQSNRLLSFSIG